MSKPRFEQFCRFGALFGRVFPFWFYKLREYTKFSSIFCVFFGGRKEGREGEREGEFAESMTTNSYAEKYKLHNRKEVEKTPVLFEEEIMRK